VPEAKGEGVSVSEARIERWGGIVALLHGGSLKWGVEEAGAEYRLDAVRPRGEGRALTETVVVVVRREVGENVTVAETKGGIVSMGSEERVDKRARLGETEIERDNVTATLGLAPLAVEE
jgi:hypothetical protein